MRNGDWLSTCECGAVWTQAKERDSEYVIDIYRSHLAYFDKPETKIL